MFFGLLCAVFVIITVKSIVSSTIINIGGIFERSNEDHQIIFEAAIKNINRENSLKYTIKHRSVVIEHDVDVYGTNFTAVSWNKPYETLKSACSVLNTGVASIITTLSEENSRAVQSLCDDKEIPVIQTMPDAFQNQECCSIRLFPQMSTLSRAFTSLIELWGWTDFTILFEEHETMVKISEMIQKQNNILIRKLTSGPNGDYIDTLKDVRKSGVTKFVLDCPLKNLNKILKQAQLLGLMMSDYSYIILNLDAHTIDLSPYQHSNTNITSFRLVDPLNPVATEIYNIIQNKKKTLGIGTSDISIENWKLSTALIIDGVALFSQVLNDHGVFNTKPLFCNSSDKWHQGSTFFNFMKTKSIHGLTGIIELDQHGYRTDFNLDIIELSDRGIVKIGTWNSTKGIQLARVYPKPSLRKGSMNDMSFKIVICDSEPYAMLKNVSTQLKGNDQFEGFGIDIIKELAHIEGFNYTFFLRIDGKNGDYNSTSKTWTGMIANILDGTADLAIGDLTITKERQQFVDFTSPFMSLGVQILYRKPTNSAPDFFSFAAPLAPEVWFLTGATFFAMSFMFYIIGRICPTEWYNPYPCLSDPPYLVNQYSFENCMWLTLGNLMQEGTDIAPRGASTRIMASFWSFFILIMVSCYTANMAAFLTTEKEIWAFTNVKELVYRADKMGINYGAITGGATQKFFERSEDKLFKKIGIYMKTHPSSMVTGNPDGVDRVFEGNYAFFMESTSIDYATQRLCDLSAIGGNLDERYYAIAMKKDSEYRNKLSSAVLRLMESGKLDQLKRKWWEKERGGGECMKSPPSTTTPPLEYIHVSGMFWITIGGILFSCGFVIFELAHNILQNFKGNKRRLKEFRKEMIFYCKFKHMTKEVCSEEPNRI